MARGKYGDRAINKNIYNLQETLKNTKAELSETKERLNKASRRLIHFESMEDIFNSRVDVLRENEQLENDLKKLSDENKALRDKLRHYAQVMTSEANAELKFSREMLADFAELGLLDDSFNNNREHKRIVKSGKNLKKQFALREQLDQVLKSRGAEGAA